MKLRTVFKLMTVLAVLAIVARAWGQTAAGNTTETTLARLQVTYENELGKLEVDNGKQAVALQEQYLKSLDFLQAQLQKSGKLEPILAIREECDRFETEKSVDPASLSDVPELQRVQAAYLTALQEIDVARSRSVLDLAGKYDRSLHSLQERATREGTLDLAVLVKEEREGLTKRPEISAARFTVAEAEAERRQAEQPPEEAPEVTGAVEASAKKFEGSPEAYIAGRFKTFCDALSADDMEKARSYVDPRYTERKGNDAVNGVLALLVGPYVKVTRVFHGRLDPGTVVLGESGTTASHRPRVWAGDQWKETRPTYWVERDGDWYIDMERRSGPPARSVGERKERSGTNVKGDGIPPRRHFRESR